VTDSFWRDPPWRGGKGGYRMGLRPIAANDWLTERIDDSERDRKLALLRNPSSGVFAATDNSLAGQNKILDEVSRVIGCDVGKHDEASAPLVRASLLVPDDLCLMEEQDGIYRLTAACVCAPSYWRLAEKIGRTLDGIHAPVPTLNDKLAPSMQQFFARLPTHAVFERRNWLLHTDGALYQPVSDAWHRIDANEVATLIVRSERQTLKRLDATTVVFTIRVTCHPLGEIAGHREAARDLRNALHALDAPERAAKGFDYFAPVVLDYLSNIDQDAP
jgi:Protein of unknown function (DUF3445)